MNGFLLSVLLYLLMNLHLKKHSSVIQNCVNFYYQFNTHNEKQSRCGTWQCNSTVLSFEKEERQQIEISKMYLAERQWNQYSDV